MRDDHFLPLSDLDWDDIEAVGATCQAVLRALSGDRPGLRALIDRVVADDRLLSLCEHYDILDKIVIHDDLRRGFRVRLHVFQAGHFDRPHNHRWTYSSLILRGSYRHTIYVPEGELSASCGPFALRPVIVRQETADDAYTLHHSLVHATTAEPHTVTLIVRGPAVKQRFLVMDRVTNRAWWQYGAKDELPEEQQRKRLGAERLAALATQLQAWSVI